MTERLKAIENEPWGDDERDTLKPCWTMVETKSEASEASEDIKEARAATGSERASPIRRSNPGLDSGPLGWSLFSAAARLGQRPATLFGANVALEKSGLETNAENEARSALLARLW